MDYSSTNSKQYSESIGDKKIYMNEREKDIIEKIKLSLRHGSNINFDSITDELLEHISRKYKDYSMKIRLFEVNTFNSPIIVKP